LPVASYSREAQASGVMMIPVPRSGIYRGVEGFEFAKAVDGVTDIVITAREQDSIAAWPHGSSYLGFIFASAETPEDVESALRGAHRKLDFKIVSALPVNHPMTGRARAAEN